VDGVAELLGSEASAALARGERVPARRAATGAGELGALIRCFVLGDVVDEEELPKGEYGDLVADGRARYDVRPYAENDGEPWFVVSDRTDGGRVRRTDHVLGIGGASTMLAHSTIRTDDATALDLGTGCGVQALHLSRHSSRVVATDLNQRCLDLAALTCALSGVGGVELRAGDLYQPVDGELFDVVVANPPFVIGASGFTYRDSGLRGDELSRRVIEGAAAHLASGGTATLLVNWLHVRGEDWQERVAQWLAATGCDAIALQREVQDPSEYVGTWLRDVGREIDEGEYGVWLDALAQLDAEAIGFGVVVLRNAGAAVPRVVVEDAPETALPPLAPYLGARLDALQLLREASDLGSLRPVLAPALLDSLAVQGELGWVEVARTLRLAGTGIATEVEVDEAGSALLAGCTGGHTLDQLSAVLAPLGVDREAVLASATELLLRGVLRLTR
jgi:methylase of polypeptide subunit release factors